MKKGFTLIELLVSLVIISLAMVFITSFVLSLKSEKGSITFSVPVLVDQAAISRTLNNDASNYGISSISISGKKCNVTYNNSVTKTIEISSDNKTIKYYKDSETYFVRTLKVGTFGSITNETSNVGSKKLYKYVINISTGDNIEVYYYGD